MWVICKAVALLSAATASRAVAEQEYLEWALISKLGAMSQMQPKNLSFLLATRNNGVKKIKAR